MSENEKTKYALRTISSMDYNSHVDCSEWCFTNGFISQTHPGGHSDERQFPAGTVVLCKFRWDKERSSNKQGWFMEGFAKVTKFSESGRPTELGESLGNTAVGRWKPPGPDEVIYDERNAEEVGIVQ